MNKKWYDKEQIACLDCGHRWVLVSDKDITNEQHKVWLKKSLEHHEQIQKEREE